MLDKLMSDPSSLTAWIVIFFLIIKDIYFWFKNKGIPGFESMNQKIDNILTRIQGLEDCSKSSNKETNKIDCVVSKLTNVEESLKSTRKDIDSILEQLEESSEIIDKLSKIATELHQWHNVTNQEGVKLWYIRPTLEKVLESLKDAIDIQTNLTKELVFELKTHTSSLNRIEEKLQKK